MPVGTDTRYLQQRATRGMIRHCKFLHPQPSAPNAAILSSYHQLNQLDCLRPKVASPGSRVDAVVDVRWPTRLKPIFFPCRVGTPSGRIGLFKAAMRRPHWRPHIRGSRHDLVHVPAELYEAGRRGSPSDLELMAGCRLFGH